MIVTIRTLVVSLSISLLAAAALAGGPPVLSVERLAPGSPEAAKGYALRVTATQCGSVVTTPLMAKVEGLVNGTRTTKDALLVPVKGVPGQYLVKRTWSGEGKFAVVLSLDSHGKATSIVRVDGSTPPQLVHRSVTGEEIDALLRDEAKLTS